ncbi:MAG: tetratricopeptide repeat protein [Moorea sp. SIO3I7]|uniref:tetratricopeptide repeat protein n=1 Tax=Moorena sp. SIO3I8 TaxID=2607833 RepID=UPI0013C001E6|nr:tetratricopeptide repeat protein [Moorena sp. SIO3I8]NEO00514.1 tetratricopeptide repeat protein [Moorena sp. SIO3I7]NEO10119.1 tetratricopeptide repeat protein [Moorena sp. SIO3I8]
MHLLNENNSHLDPKFYKNLAEPCAESQQDLESKALHFFQTELNNIKLAISYAQEEQQWERVIEISESLVRFLRLRTYWEDLEKIQKDALSAAQQAGKRLIEAHLLEQFAEVQRLLGNAKNGIDKCEESRRIFQELNDEYGEAKALYTLGYLNRSLGNWDKSAEAFEDSLKLLINLEKNQNTDVDEELAEALDGLGQIYTRQGRLEIAKEILLKSLNLNNKLNNQFLISKTTNNLGKVYIELYNIQNQLNFLEEAKRLFEKSLEIGREQNNRQGQGVSLNELGKVHRLMGNYNKALEYYNESLKVKKQVSATGGGASDKNGEGLTYMEIGFLYENQGEKEKAKNTFQKALEHLNFYSPHHKNVSQILDNKYC